MSLNLKVTLIMAVTLLVVVAFAHSVLLFVVNPSFDKLEAEQARSNYARIKLSIDRELRFVSQVAEDWASWDETYAYAVDRSSDYEADNLVFSTFLSLGINAILLFDVEGRHIGGGIYDLKTGRAVPLDIFSKGNLAPGSRLITRTSEGDKLSGLIMTDRGPLLLASLPVLTNEDRGPVRGSLIMGRFFTEESIEGIKEQTKVRFDASLYKTERSYLTSFISDRLDRGDSSPIFYHDTEQISAYSILRDINDANLLVLRVDTPTDISQLGHQAVLLTAFLIALCALFALLTMSVLLSRYVLQPVSRLTKHVVSVGKSGELVSDYEMSGSDEIATLSREFNSMIHKLKTAREELMEQSFKAGMAEIATGTIHNLRNALNPVVSRVSQLQLRLQDSSTDNLEKALAEVACHSEPSARKEKLTRYVELASRGLIEQHGEIAKKLDDVLSQVAEIEEILDWQDDFAKAEIAVEQVDLGESILAATRLVPRKLLKSVEVVIDPSVKKSQGVLAQRISLVQIIQNILINAAEACGKSSDGRIVIGAKTVTDVKHSVYVRLSIGDNGAGLERGQLDKIFQRSYTTKAGARRGLGLHWCANALGVMNGSIEATSDGPNCGTVMSITLPAA